MDLSNYAKLVMQLKGIDNADLQKVEMNVKQAFAKKYNAICLDIDGTLVENQEITDELLQCLYNILKKHVPIIFITGRGESGLKQFTNDFILSIKEKYGDSFNLFKDIMGISNDGTFLFYSSGNFEKGFLDKCDCLVEPKSLDKLTALAEKLEKNEVIDKKIINYSYCNSYNDVLASIRIDITDKTLPQIKEYLTKVKDADINMSIGEYEKRKILQLSLTDKGKAVENTENFLGIPKNSILRIADQGEENGNDFNMLDCLQGFSVNTVSKNIDGCIPIFDEKGIQLKNVSATEYILKHLNIFPTICLEKPNRKKYIIQLAEAERLIAYERRPFINQYNQIFSENFSNAYTFEDVFDAKSGAIVFKDWEWNIIPDSNELKRLFSQSVENKFRYILDTDDGKIMRGADTYYYFLANKCKNEKVTQEHINEWISNNFKFFKDVKQVLDSYKITDSNDKKLLLGVLDNLRNVNLMMLNACILKNFQNDNIIMSFDKYLDDFEINSWYNIENETCDLITNICLNKNLDMDECVGKSKEILMKFFPLFKDTILDIVSRNDSDLNQKCFRSYREIDNFIENYITMDYATKKMLLENPNIDDKSVNFIGIAYGGLELPFIAKKILSEKGSINTSVMKLSGKYKDRHSENSFEKSEEASIQIIGKNNFENANNIVADDNVLTGKTLQIALNLLFSNNVDVANIIAIRYPSINRVEQMFMKGHGAIDTTKFFSYIKGLMFPSPYSKIKSVENGLLDELGVFNKSRDRILKYLYKNGRYSKNSEVNDSIITR